MLQGKVITSSTARESPLTLYGLKRNKRARCSTSLGHVALQYNVWRSGRICRNHGAKNQLNTLASGHQQNDGTEK